MSTPAFENLRDHQGQADMDKPIFNRDRGESVQVLLDRITELEQQLEEMRTLADEQTDDLAKAGLQLAALRDALVQIQKTYDLSEAWNVASAALSQRREGD